MQNSVIVDDFSRTAEHVGLLIKRVPVTYICIYLYFDVFDVHRAVHRNINSTVKPTGCTNVSNLFYFIFVC